MKNIKFFNKRSKRVVSFFMLTVSLVFIITLGFFANDILNLQAVASNPGHDASGISPGTFDGGVAGVFTFPGFINLGGVSKDEWPSGGDSDWTINGNDMYSAVTGDVKIAGGANPANPNNARLLVSSGAYGIEATGTTGVYSFGTSTGYWGGSTTGNGMYATSNSGTGVWGGSISGNGVVGTSNTASGVYGRSTNGNGVYGVVNNNNAGVVGSNTSTGVGVRGVSPSGYGVYCDGSSCGGNQAWTNASDERLKKNIMTLENALEKVKNLRGVSFEWKDERYEGKNIGFIAQEVNNIIPEVVDQGSDGYYSIQSGQITSILVEAMKEQQKQIEAQEKEIRELREEMNILKSKIIK